MRVPPLEYSTEVIRYELKRLRHPLRIAIFRFKNPFNIGAIIRTAHSFLVREILLIGDAPYYERASMGMEKYENIVPLANERDFLHLVKEKRWKLVAFEKDNAHVGLWDASFPEDCVFVFGNEDSGVGPEILKKADMVVGIPMFGINHSYPVSVAAGIAMAEWTRRYYKGGRLIVPRSDFSSIDSPSPRKVQI